MKRSDHLSNDLLVRALDEELSGSETLVVASHVGECDDCRNKLQELRAFSDEVEALVASSVPEASLIAREKLASTLDEIGRRSTHAGSRKLVWQFGLGMGIAATLAFAVLFTPHDRQPIKSTAPTVHQAQITNTFDIDGETFIALPYSNPDLPLTGPHIVQMQVPVSSLEDAGIVFESVANQIAVPDQSVLADVLLGMDGQPLGVHILETD